MTENPTYKYNISLRILHWIMAIMLIGMIVSGYIMVGLNADIAPYKWDVYGLHKSFGICFLLLSFVRIYIRLTSYIPPYKYEFSNFIKLMSGFVQKAFYVFFLAIPLTGFFSSVWAGYDISFFGYKLPKFFAENKPFAKQAHELHEILPYVALVFIFMHILGVIKHRYYDKKDILDRIW
ncbi:MAG: cytochrome b [Alphaproteobacteria bacterium]